jgi:hypothetical protein
VGAFEIDYKWHWQKPYRNEWFVWTHWLKDLNQFSIDSNPLLQNFGLFWKVRCHTCCIQHGHRWCWHCIQKLKLKAHKLDKPRGKSQSLMFMRFHYG